MKSPTERYVKLILAMGEHDSDYVDAYYGPPQWRQEVQASRPPLDAIRAEAEELRGELESEPAAVDELSRLRQRYVIRQLQALLARIDILGGKRMTFDEESQALYDAVAPHHDAAYFQRLIDELAGELPGRGPVTERLEAFRAQFAIPREKLDPVFAVAIAAGRAKTLERIALPAEETFTIEYVNNKAWSGYNWYQGGFRSLIQINTDLPIFIDRAIDLACHEGYPGHHVYNMLLEKSLVHDRGWQEFSVYALFSPQSLIAEGSANYGIDMAFPGQERVAFEKETLFPAAGLDAARAEQYYRAFDLTSRLAYAGNEAARRYLDGEIGAADAAQWLVDYALMAPARAEQRVKFFDKYRSYVINYNLGKDLVARYVEKRAGSDEDARWRVFGELLSSPRLPSDLTA